MRCGEWEGYVGGWWSRLRECHVVPFGQISLLYDDIEMTHMSFGGCGSTFVNIKCGFPSTILILMDFCVELCGWRKFPCVRFLGV